LPKVAKLSHTHALMDFRIPGNLHEAENILRILFLALWTREVCA
jgi:hypothetical protein